MAKYRAVLLVPTIVEFENNGTQEHVSEQVKRIASGMGRTVSVHPRQKGAPYEPKILECCVVEGEPKPSKTPPEIEFVPELA